MTPFVSIFLASKILETRNFPTFLEVVKGVSHYTPAQVATKAVTGIPGNSF